MTEAKWLKSICPREMLRWLAPDDSSERKALLLMHTALSHRMEFYSGVRQPIVAALGMFVEGMMSRIELDEVYRREGLACGAPSRFILENASFSIANDIGPRKIASRLIRDIFGNPFRPVVAKPAWLTPDAVAIATAIYADRAFDRLPILADALEEAGCTNADVLLHCRQPGEHVRGCWVVDLVLGKT